MGIVVPQPRLFFFSNITTTVFDATQCVQTGRKKREIIFISFAVDGKYSVQI